MGSTDDHLQPIASLVAGSGMSVLGGDYRSRSNDCFPAPLDDAEEVIAGCKRRVFDLRSLLWQ